MAVVRGKGHMNFAAELLCTRATITPAIQTDSLKYKLIGCINTALYFIALTFFYFSAVNSRYESYYEYKYIEGYYDLSLTQQALLHRSAGPHAAGAAAALRVRGLPHLLPRRGQPAEQHGAGEGAPLAGARHRLQRMDAGVLAGKLRYLDLEQRQLQLI